MIHIELSAVDERDLPGKYKSKMTNWLTISEVLYEDGITRKTILQMLRFEIYNLNRAYVVQRIYGKFNAMRDKADKEFINGVREGHREIPRPGDGSPRG